MVSVYHNKHVNLGRNKKKRKKSTQHFCFIWSSAMYGILFLYLFRQEPDLVQKILWVHGHISFFSPVSSKGNNLCDLFAFLKANPFQTGKLLKKRICSYGNKFFSLKVHYREGRKNDNYWVAAPESVSIHLKGKSH